MSQCLYSIRSQNTTCIFCHCAIIGNQALQCYWTSENNDISVSQIGCLCGVDLLHKLVKITPTCRTHSVNL